MSEHNRPYHPIDQHMRNAADKISVDYNPKAWDALSNMLDTAPKMATKRSKTFFKRFSLNSILIFIGIISTATVVIYLAQINNNPATPEKEQIIAPMQIDSLKNYNSHSIQKSVVDTVALNPNLTTDQEIENINKSVTFDSILINNPLNRTHIDSLERMQPKVEIQDSIPKKPFVFW